MYRLCECDTVFWIHLIWVKAVIKPSQLLLHWSSVVSNYLPLIDKTWATNFQNPLEWMWHLLSPHNIIPPTTVLIVMFSHFRMSLRRFKAMKPDYIRMKPIQLMIAITLLNLQGNRNTIRNGSSLRFIKVINWFITLLLWSFVLT